MVPERKDAFRVYEINVAAIGLQLSDTSYSQTLLLLARVMNIATVVILQFRTDRCRQSHSRVITDGISRIRASKYSYNIRHGIAN